MTVKGHSISPPPPWEVSGAAEGGRGGLGAAMAEEKLQELLRDYSAMDEDEESCLEGMTLNKKLSRMSEVAGEISQAAEQGEAGKLEDCWKRLWEEAICPICLEFFRNPVMLTCGDNFCRACITQSWGEESTEAPCPQCRETVQTKILTPIWALANIAEKIRESTCRKHLEPLKLFCQEDQTSICEACYSSEEHRGHHVAPLSSAARSSNQS